MARLIAGMGTSHVPGVGAAMDNGKTHEDYWVELFKGFEPIRAWHAKNVPDVNIIVFNDHATSMSLNHYSTFMMGVAEQFQPLTKAGARARCRWSRAIPSLPGIWSRT